MKQYILNIMIVCLYFCVHYLTFKLCLFVAHSVRLSWPVWLSLSFCICLVKAQFLGKEMLVLPLQILSETLSFQEEFSEIITETNLSLHIRNKEL